MIKETLINFCESTESIYGILEIFKLYFFKEFNKLKVKERQPIIKALPYIFRMWYYSTLIDETPLSAANVINSQIKEGFGDGFLVVPKLIPVYKYKVLKDFQFEYRVFSLDNYPVLTDLKLFLKHCTPDTGVDDNGLLLEEERAKIIDSLTFNEVYYITYLTNLSYDLKLLKKMPSIGVHRSMVVSENINNFFILSAEEQMEKLIAATITSASKPLLETFPSEKKLFSKEALTKLFTSSCSLDEYLEVIYNKYQIDIDFDKLDIKDLKDLQDLDISEDTLISASFNLELSFLMDAYLLTPLGYYLQCLLPFYFDCFDFSLTFTQLLQAEEMQVPSIKLYFGMGNSFSLTFLGEKLLTKGSVSTKDNLQELVNKADYDVIYDAILHYHSDEIEIF